MSNKFTIGVDEVGRGPLAGPVTVAAVMIPKGEEYKNAPLDIRDSKKYSHSQRVRMFNFFNDEVGLDYDVSSVFPQVIDRENIFNATTIAATRSVTKLMKRLDINSDECDILLDGSMRLNVDEGIEYISIKRGDETISAIKIASIMAKVRRDRSMVRYHDMFPEYDFASNKGYGTKQHMNAIRKHGKCRIHRMSFKLTK